VFFRVGFSLFRPGIVRAPLFLIVYFIIIIIIKNVYKKVYSKE